MSVTRVYEHTYGEALVLIHARLNNGKYSTRSGRGVWQVAAVWAERKRMEDEGK